MEKFNKKKLDEVSENYIKSCRTWIDVTIQIDDSEHYRRTLQRLYKSFVRGVKTIKKLTIKLNK